MDEKDRKILSILQENSKLSTRQIAKKALLPITTAHNRIKKMKRDGIIEKYTIIPNYKKIGMSVVAYVLITVDYKLLGTNEQAKKEIEKMISQYGIVENFSLVTGVTDAILRIRTTDIDTLNNFLVQRLRQLDFATKTETLIVLKDIQ
ncbi:MAG: Lrp/AsnC family transcriptional regulator [Nanoarchaeota archaeon]